MKEAFEKAAAELALHRFTSAFNSEKVNDIVKGKLTIRNVIGSRFYLIDQEDISMFGRHSRFFFSNDDRESLLMSIEEAFKSKGLLSPLEALGYAIEENVDCVILIDRDQN